MQLLEDWLKAAIALNASDIHLAPRRPPFLRVHGELVPLIDTPVLTPEFTRQIIESLMSPEEYRTFNQNLNIELGVYKPHIGHFRLSAYHQAHGHACALRIIPNKIPSFEALQLPAIFKKLAFLSNGLVLISGSTGSGKSTTLASMIDAVNAIRSCHIITIEDPIEFIHPEKKAMISQIQLHRDTSSMEQALHAALRQDPDIILLGELRNYETMKLALMAAETGHLVLSTMHANNAPLAISRIIDMCPASEKTRVRHLIAETLQAVVCQTLMKSTDQQRVPAFEVMLANQPVRHYIRQDMMYHLQNVIQTSADLGMCTFERAMNELVQLKKILPATAQQYLSLQQAYYDKKI